LNLFGQDGQSKCLSEWDAVCTNNGSWSWSCSVAATLSLLKTYPTDIFTPSIAISFLVLFVCASSFWDEDEKYKKMLANINTVLRY